MADFEDEVVLVDEHDRPIGTARKMDAHRSGQLHRAFSVFVFDASRRLLLQQRAASKYHSGGLWTNTCCSHPRPGEDTAAAAHRRLREEMGIVCELTQVHRFVYRAQIGDLIEHEVDHVFFGSHDAEPRVDPEEVQDWMWIDVVELGRRVRTQPSRYSYWLAACIDKVIELSAKPGL
jgi:isopentenyl-diphosphate delta-isomerase